MDMNMDIEKVTTYKVGDKTFDTEDKAKQYVQSQNTYDEAVKQLKTLFTDFSKQLIKFSKEYPDKEIVVKNGKLDVHTADKTSEPSYYGDIFDLFYSLL